VRPVDRECRPSVFNAQNTNTSKDAASIPATFLRVTVSV
jgi:hypothetical protein